MFERLQFCSAPVEDDSIVLTPAFVITRARDEFDIEPVNAFMLQVQWLLWGFGIVIDFR